MSVPESIEKAAKILGSQEALGRLVNVTKAAVSHWKRIDSVPVEYCSRIEEATGGAVTRQELRPKDWHAIWPELSAVSQVTPSPITAPAPARQASAG